MMPTTRKNAPVRRIAVLTATLLASANCLCANGKHHIAQNTEAARVSTESATVDDSGHTTQPAAQYLSCTACNGKGMRQEQCPYCSGKGYQGTSRNPQTCIACNGSGIKRTHCSRCNGTGTIPISSSEAKTRQ